MHSCITNAANSSEEPDKEGTRRGNSITSISLLYTRLVRLFGKRRSRSNEEDDIRGHKLAQKPFTVCE